MVSITSQDHLSLGATIVPIILASNKTPVTCHTRGLQMHPVFLTIGNIQSDIRMQASSHAWHCITFIPSSKIKVHSKCKTLLSSQLFHWLLDVITTRLKEAAKNSHMVVDASGNMQRCFTPCLLHCQPPWTTTHCGCLKECLTGYHGWATQLWECYASRASNMQNYALTVKGAMRKDWSLGPWSLSNSCKSHEASQCQPSFLAWLAIHWAISFPHGRNPSFPTQVFLQPRAGVVQSGGWFPYTWHAVYEPPPTCLLPPFCHWCSTLATSVRSRPPWYGKTTGPSLGWCQGIHRWLYPHRSFSDWVHLLGSGSNIYHLLYHCDGTSVSNFSLEETVYYWLGGTEGYESAHQELQDSKAGAHGQLCTSDESEWCTYPVHSRCVGTSPNHPL